MARRFLYIVPRNVVNKIKQQITENEKKIGKKCPSVISDLKFCYRRYNEVTLKRKCQTRYLRISHGLA